MLNKRVEKRNGQKLFLLGRAKEDGKLQWLEESSWDCDWYWGLGYVASFTNDNDPARARDINGWSHFDGLFLSKGAYAYDAFKDYFEETTLTDKEVWTLLELMKTCYTLRGMADLTHIGGGHVTTNPCHDLLKDDDMNKKINKVMLPSLFKEVYKLLGDTEE